MNTCRDCRNAHNLAVARIVEKYVQELPDGRFVLAVWSDRNAQWTASMSSGAAKRTGCSGVFARTLVGIANDPCVPKYRHRSSAIRALDAETRLSIEGGVYDGLCPAHRREAARVVQEWAEEERAREERMYAQA